MELFEHTFFINLDHRTDRLEHITKEFEKMGIQAERVQGIQPRSPAVGCTMSILNVWNSQRAAIMNKYLYVKMISPF